MDREITQQKIFRILSEQALCVVSTVSKFGQPQSALMGFSQNSDLEIMIGTKKSKRQYANLQQNHKVSIVVHDGRMTTVQYEGVAQEITDKAELATRQKAHFAKLPDAERFADTEGQVYLSIKPTWARLTVHDGSDPEEIDFNEVFEQGRFN